MNEKLAEALQAKQTGTEPTVETTVETTVEPTVDNSKENDNQQNIGISTNFSELEQKAYAKGWRSKEEYKGDSESFISANEYIRYGNLQEATAKQLSDQQKLFENQIDQLSKLKDAEIQEKVKDLKIEQRKAIDDADTTSYDEIQNRIDNLKKPTPIVKPTAVQGPRPQEVVDWEAKHSWINDTNHPRTIRAQQAWGDYVYENPQGSITDALTYVNEKLGLSNSNPMKNTASVTSTGGKVSRSTTSNVLNWDSLSPQEVRLWEAGGKRMWKNDKSKFLKSVSSSRSEK